MKHQYFAQVEVLLLSCKCLCFITLNNIGLKMCVFVCKFGLEEKRKYMNLGNLQLICASNWLPIKPSQHNSLGNQCNLHSENNVSGRVIFVF